MSGLGHTEEEEEDDEENPRVRDELNEDDPTQGVPTTPELCFCQRRWDSARLPSLNLPEDYKKIYFEEGVPLYKAILNGDSAKVKLILRKASTDLMKSSSITAECETALHIAVAARQADVVKDLVEQMNEEELELQDKSGNTAFCVGAAAGSVKIAGTLTKKNPKLLLLRGSCNKTPLNIAAVYGYPDMIRFIYERFEDHLPHLEEKELEEIFLACIHAALFVEGNSQEENWQHQKGKEKAPNQA